MFHPLSRAYSGIQSVGGGSRFAHYLLLPITSSCPKIQTREANGGQRRLIQRNTNVQIAF